MHDVTIGLIGLGTVGTGVARLLTEHRRAHRAPRGQAGPMEMGRGARSAEAARRVARGRQADDRRSRR